ncbi:S-adenosyl-L-methionine-dependent methyltransferase [Xylariaceae sp. FL0255]|nr:S-adenosyl-L-methionine-dependent methyltransferase [Xylariaceae sp. FL0255]
MSSTQDLFAALDASQPVKDLLRRLHAVSSAQEEQTNKIGGKLEALKTLKRQGGSEAEETYQREFDDLMRDQMVVLEPEKALFVYQLLRALRATKVVEAGTSFGVSTIYLALAVGQNATKLGVAAGGRAKVIATENEPSKIARARQNWKDAGQDVEKWIELREGDLRETLSQDLPDEIDFVLFDIWTPMLLPTLKLLEPKLKKGAVLVSDNIISSAEGYHDFHEHIRNHSRAYRSLILPYLGGLEFTLYDP